jgi:hypothetical protein
MAMSAGLMKHVSTHGMVSALLSLCSTCWSGGYVCMKVCMHIRTYAAVLVTCKHREALQRDERAAAALHKPSGLAAVGNLVHWPINGTCVAGFMPGQ